MTDDDAVSVRIAGAYLPIDDAAQAVISYPRRTPGAYDLPPYGAGSVSHAELLRRTRYLASRLSEAQLKDVLARSADAPWDDRLDGADLAEMDHGDDMWEAADRLYLHFVWPRVERVGFAKAHKYLHLVHPGVFPILDSKVRTAYRRIQSGLAKQTGLAGSDNWRRRTWLAVRDDLRWNRDRGALDSVRARARDLAPDDRRDHVERVAGLGDLRLLDLLTWKAHAHMER